MTSGFPRVNCVVPGCRRGTTRIKPLEPGYRSLESNGEPEWICADHWRLVPKVWKRRRSLYWRRIKKIWPEQWPGPPGPDRARLFRLERIIQRMWARMKRRAANPMADLPADAELDEIERRFGIK